MLDTINKDIVNKYKSFKILIVRHPSVFILAGLFICVTIVIQILTNPSCLTELGFIRCIANQIYTYFKDWGILIGATATILLAWTAFWNISDTRFFRSEEDRKQRANRIVVWAKDTISALNPPEDTGKDPVQRLNKYSDQLGIVTIEFTAIVADAQFLGGDIKAQTEKAVINFVRYTIAIDDALSLAKKGKRPGPPPTTQRLIKELMELITVATKIR